MTTQNHTPATADGWILTASGVRFELFDPTPDMVRIDDIAHALANICRFNGHTRQFYSVAQHSVLVSRHVHESEQLAALLHDATEAYVGDMVRPLKRHMWHYKRVEEGIWSAISGAFGFLSITPAIKVADERALMTERRDLLIPSAYEWGEGLECVTPFTETITPLPPSLARAEFLERFRELTEGGTP